MYSVSVCCLCSFFSTCLKNHGLCHFPISFSWPGWQESTRFPVMTTAWSLENTRHSTNSLPLSLFTSRSKTCQESCTIFLLCFFKAQWFKSLLKKSYLSRLVQSVGGIIVQFDESFARYDLDLHRNQESQCSIRPGYCIKQIRILAFRTSCD